MKKKFLTFLLALATSVGMMHAAVDDSGSCGDNVTYSFNGATGAMTITGTGPMTVYTSGSSLLPWKNYKESITSVTVTDGVTSVSQYSFGQCTNLTTVVIGNDVETIGQFAFNDCGASFTSLTLGSSLKSVGMAAFLWDTNIAELVLPESLETIGDYAFCQLKAITTVTIPSKVTSIGQSAFYNCIALTSIYTEATTPPTLGATVFDYVPTSIPLYVPNGSVAAYTAAAQWNAFSIQGYDPAPGGGSTPANSCGDGLTWELKDSVLTISYDGEGTGEMTDFDYEYESPVIVAPWKENKSEIKTVIVGDGVKSIGNYAFNDLSENFTAVTIANSVERIGVSAFMNDKWVTEMTLPSSLKTIDERCFAANFGFTSITIPSGVTSIGYQAFSYCTGLTSLTCEATTLPTLGTGVFSGIKNKQNILLYVPSESVDAYTAAAQWSAFNVQAIPAPTPSVTAARFLYNYDCQRNPAFPEVNNACTLSGFKDPYEGYKGYRNGNIALGPWKLEFVANYTPSNHYGCASQVNTAVYLYYTDLSDEEREAKKLEVPIFRLWQYNLTEREYQPAAYGIVCAYAGEANAQDHAALFISSNNMGCFLSGHQHTSSFNLTCENDLTTGLDALVAAASAPSDPYYDVVWPVIVSIDAIGTVELSEHCKYYIEGSRAAYNALTNEQKAQVTNYSTLTDAEAAWADLVAVAQPYADAVIALINAIPDPVVYTQDCKDKIDAAQAAYDALTDGQKLLVTNADVLPQAIIDYINAAPSVNIVFEADNSNIKKYENVTLPKAFTSGGDASEMVTMLKEMYNLDGEYDIWYCNSNNEAVTFTKGYAPTWVVAPFMGTVRVAGAIENQSNWSSVNFTVDISLELPTPASGGSTPTPSGDGDKLSGAFSVSGTKVVYFSKGNLQATTSDQGATWTWGFAENQWDYVGNAAANTSFNYTGTETGNGSYDLFGWIGESSTLNDYRQYGIGSNYDFTDCGNTAGEDLKADWRTLTYDEWQYLIKSRNNAANLLAYATVNGKTGLILLPDSWTSSSVALTITTANYTTNTISTSDWSTLEEQGCVFLPAAGSREDKSVYGVGEGGDYWSSSSPSGKQYDEGSAYCFFFDTDFSKQADGMHFNKRGRGYGLSVRLVSETAPSGGSTPDPTPSGGDVLPGAFSISSTETVNFSKANLQYVGGAWQFAENQWNVIGESQADNNRDLFGWGTGDAPNKVSEDNGDYATFNDWGDNLEGGWRTLTKQEWRYLFDDRETSCTVNNVSNARHTHATINTDGTAVHGIILFPDGYAGGTPAGVTWGTINAGSNWSTTCTTAGWAALEEAGCVFLPAAGQRSANDVYNVDVRGFYWSSSLYDWTEGKVCGVAFNSGNCSAGYEDYPNKGFSVRLVKDASSAPASTAVVIGDPNNASEVSTFLTTYDGQTIDELIIDRPVLNNMYNTLCLPFDMDATQIAASSLNGVEIREFTGASVDGTTLNLSVGDPVNAVVAGRPYFVKYSATSQLDDLHFEDVTINNAILDDKAVTFDGVTFKGTFTPFVMPNGLDFQGGYLFLGQNNQLFWPNTNNPLKPFRAYFYVNVDNAPSGMPLRRGMPARIVEGKNVATGVENAQGDNVQSTKVLENGVLYIIKNDVRYNAQGQVVK